MDIQLEMMVDCSWNKEVRVDEYLSTSRIVPIYDIPFGDGHEVGNRELDCTFQLPLPPHNVEHNPLKDRTSLKHHIPNTNTVSQLGK